MLTQSQLSDMANTDVKTKLFGPDVNVRFDIDVNDRWEKKLSFLLREYAEFRKFYNKRVEGATLRCRVYRNDAVYSRDIQQYGNRREKSSITVNNMHSLWLTLTPANSSFSASRKSNQRLKISTGKY